MVAAELPAHSAAPPDLRAAVALVRAGLAPRVALVSFRRWPGIDVDVALLTCDGRVAIQVTQSVHAGLVDLEVLPEGTPAR